MQKRSPFTSSVAGACPGLRSGGSSLPFSLVLLLLLLAYPLSYTPAVRFRMEPQIDGDIDGDIILIPPSIAAYKLVEWLIDETPLREPLFWWADVWGVREHVEVYYMWRTDDWD